MNALCLRGANGMWSSSSLHGGQCPLSLLPSLTSPWKAIFQPLKMWKFQAPRNSRLFLSWSLYFLFSVLLASTFKLSDHSALCVFRLPFYIYFCISTFPVCSDSSPEPCFVLWPSIQVLLPCRCVSSPCGSPQSSLTSCWGGVWELF